MIVRRRVRRRPGGPGQHRPDACRAQGEGGDRLAKIGPAPEFTLTTRRRAAVLGDLRGKVVAVTFIYATCTDTCPS